MTQSRDPAESLRQFLPTLTYFEDLSGDAIDRLAQAAIRHFDSCEIIFLEGEPASGLWIIDSAEIGEQALKDAPQ